MSKTSRGWRVAVSVGWYVTGWLVLVGLGSSLVRAQGPFAWYSFDTAGQPGLDRVGGNNGSPVNTTQVAGLRGLAASFSNGYIKLPATIPNLKAGDFTLSVFVKG